jgi:hypothetical protein
MQPAILYLPAAEACWVSHLAHILIHSQYSETEVGRNLVIPRSAATSISTGQSAFYLVCLSIISGCWPIQAFTPG